MKKNYKQLWEDTCKSFNLYKDNITLVESEKYTDKNNKSTTRVEVRVNGDFWREEAIKNINTPLINQWVCDVYGNDLLCVSHMYGLWENKYHNTPKVNGDEEVIVINYFFQ